MAPYKYRGRARKVEGIIKRSKQSGGGYDSYIRGEYSMYKPREGDNTIRILPPADWDQEKWGDGWEIPIFLHYNVGPDNGSYLCANKMSGEPCPVCDMRREAEDQEEAYSLRPNWRALCWVIDRDKESAGPQWWAMPIGVFREINARSVDKKTKEPILVDDPEEGYDVMFTREGTDQRTSYTAVEVARDASPLHDDQRRADKWLKYVEEHPLPDLLNFYDADYIEQVLVGKSDRKRRAEEDDEDEEETETRKPRATHRSRREASAEDEEIEKPKRTRRSLATEEEDEEEEDDKPLRQSARRRPSRDQEEEDEDTEAEAEPEAEEDEEEQRPAGRRRIRRPAKDEDKEEEDADKEESSDPYEEEDDKPSAQGRRSLGRLRRGRR